MTHSAMLVFVTESPMPILSAIFVAW